jgi:hypothetical protein
VFRGPLRRAWGGLAGGAVRRFAAFPKGLYSYSLGRNEEALRSPEPTRSKLEILMQLKSLNTFSVPPRMRRRPWNGADAPLGYRRLLLLVMPAPKIRRTQNESKAPMAQKDAGISGRR